MSSREAEAFAIAEVQRLAALMAPHMDHCWHIGDGRGGWVLETIAQASGRATHWGQAPDTTFKKKKIPQRLRTAVFERDEYSCKHCGSHVDLRADHILAESLGGPTTLDNLQTLCHPCNSKKGVKPAVEST